MSYTQIGLYILSSLAFFLSGFSLCKALTAQDERVMREENLKQYLKLRSAYDKLLLEEQRNLELPVELTRRQFVLPFGKRDPRDVFARREDGTLGPRPVAETDGYTRLTPMDPADGRVKPMVPTSTTQVDEHTGNDDGC